MPASLRGKLDLRVTRCEPSPRGGGLMIAELELSTGATEVRIPGLRCGAYRPGTDDALFLERVPLAERMGPNQSVYLRSIFQADATHTECRCVVGGVERLRERPAFDAGPANEPDFRFGRGEPEPRAEPERWPGADMRRKSPLQAIFPWLRDREEARRPAPRSPPPAPRLPPPGPDVLRRERVLLPRAELHDQPAGAGLGQSVRGGDEVDVLGLRGGWKQIRVPDTGALGWILDDAATADTLAPERLAERLRVLDAYLDPGHSRATDREGLCRALDRGELDDLVFALLPEIHAVFVTSLWWALPEPERDAFQVWVSECHEVRRIVDVASGADLRDLDWGEAPGTVRSSRVP
ncbi:MAG: hypothetical protein QNK05_22345 [Myxococcota bacterium]|nr:hypothetical protein [Myxococcota bacterium]